MDGDQAGEHLFEEGMIVVILYIVLFAAIIWYTPFFETDLFKNKKLPLLSVFFIKVACGFFLTWIYTRYYTDRSTADIFKYYDDAKVIYSAFEKGNFSDYLRMVLGISNDNSYFDENYYSHMNHWYRQNNYGAYNDDHTIIRVNALIMPFAFGSFHVHTMVMCFLSLCGLMALYRTFKDFLPSKQTILFIAIFLLPSVLFWGSGVLKEGILLFAMGYLFYSFFQAFIHKRQILLNLAVLLTSLCLLSINKNYLLVAIVPALGCFWLVDHFKVSKPFLFYLGLYIVVFFGSLGVSSIFFNNKMLTTLSLKHRDFIAVAKGGVFLQNGREFARVAPDKKEFLDSLPNGNFKIKPGSQYMYWKNENLNDTIFVNSSTDTSTYYLVWDMPLAGSAIEMQQLEPTYSSLFKTAPIAMYNSLCKPGFFSARSMLERVAALENSFILLFLILCTAYSRTGMNKNLFSLCFFLSVTVLFLIGYTTPVAGAIMRYKVAALPFMVLCGIVIFDVNKLKIFSDRRKA